MDLRSLVASVVVAGAAVGTYHLFHGDREPPAPDDSRLLQLEARVRALEHRPDRGARLAEEVERRVAVLEARDLAAPPGPPGAPSPAGAPDPVVEAREVAARQWRAQDLEEARARIRRGDASGRLGEAQVGRAAELLADYAASLRALYEGKSGSPPEEREALRRRAQEMQAGLLRDLSAVVPEDLARALAGTESAGASFGGR